MPWPDELPGLGDFLWVALNWDKFKQEFEKSSRERARIEAEKRAREANEAAAREIAERQAQLVRKHLAMEVYELDKVFPKDPDILRSELLYGEPYEYRVKMLELALLRGGSYPYKDLQGWAALPDGYAPMSQDGAASRMTHQRMALDAVMGPGGERLFVELSKSNDAPPNTDRVPATQLMFMMLQPGGLKGDNDGRVAVEKWMMDLPPETRGRAMYHLVEAASTRSYGASTQITSIETPWFGVGWEFKDGRWEGIVHNIEASLKGQLNGKDADWEEFKDGWKGASKRLDDKGPTTGTQ